MHRSIELGRAVLSTPTTNLELWLKTLITISPQQERTNFQQYNVTSLLDLFSSGEAWVGRGNGMHIDLDLTFRGQPIADELLRQLSEALIAGPASTLAALTVCITDKTTSGMETAELAAIIAI